MTSLPTGSYHSGLPRHRDSRHSADRLDRSYDLILIGSGMGAMTVASLMAQLRGKRVLVVERHFKAGGFTHDFKRQHFHWDVGIHYIGQMNPGSSTRQLFDLITQQGVQWHQMPEPFDKFIYPDFAVDWYGDRKRLQADLIQQFPQEIRAIRRYFRDLPKAATALFLRSLRLNSQGVAKLLGYLGQWWSSFSLALTTQTYLDRHFRDPKLKAILTSQWGDYGLPPALSPFAVHATVALHYLNGAYYPVGGAGTIAQSIIPLIEAEGGQVLVNREATEIVIENGRAIGVKVRHTKAMTHPEEIYYAPSIISSIGAANTYLKLIPEDYPISFRASLRQFVRQQPPTTNVTLYLGLKQDPRSLGFQGENYWIYDSIDHNATYDQRSQWVLNGQPPQCYVSFPSLKDPQATAHTAEIIAWVDYDSFAPWRTQAWLHREEDYQRLKLRISQALIAQVDRHYPGFANLIDYQELSTPLSNEHFTGHHKGGIYGLAATSERYAAKNADWTKVKTPLPGLYLTGADVYMGGIVAAMMAGVTTVSCLPDGLSFPQVFTSAARQSKQSLSLTQQYG